MLPLLPFTTPLQHLPSLANPMITQAIHQVNKEKLGPASSGPLHKKITLQLCKVSSFKFESLVAQPSSAMLPAVRPSVFWRNDTGLSEWCARNPPAAVASLDYK